jgi:hypothetical protein
MTVLLITGALVTGNYSPSFAAPATKASATPQVLIGAGDAPRAGAMLDLNSTTQGLLLPTIELTADTTEFVLVDTDKASAYGMMIYNTNDEVADGKGVYVWSGSAWYLMTAFPVSVLLDPDAITYGTIGLQEPLTLVLKPDQVQHKSVIWDSSNKTVATVDQTGVVTTLSNGSTTITATTADGQVATCVVGVQSTCTDGVFAADLCWSTESKTVTNVQIACDEGWRVPTVDELSAAAGNGILGLTNINYWCSETEFTETVEGGCQTLSRSCVNGIDGTVTLVPVVIAIPPTDFVYGYVGITPTECGATRPTMPTCNASIVGQNHTGLQCEPPCSTCDRNGLGKPFSLYLYKCSIIKYPSACSNADATTTNELKCIMM